MFHLFHASRQSTRVIGFALPALTLTLGLLGQTTAHAVALTEPVSAAFFADTTLPGTTSALRPELAGTVLEDLIMPFSFNGVAGTVQNRVVRETSTGTLDFYWKINVDTAEGRGDGVSAFRLTDFGYTNLKDADWRIDGLGTAAPTTGRLFSATGEPDGSINFLFDSAVTAGTQSRFFFLHTDATAYARSASFDMLAGPTQSLSGQYATFAPAVPEPAAYAMALIGLGVVGGAMLRRRRA